jgi:hypothetical protein
MLGQPVPLDRSQGSGRGCSFSSDERRPPEAQHPWPLRAGAQNRGEADRHGYAIQRDGIRAARALEAKNLEAIQLTANRLSADLKALDDGGQSSATALPLLRSCV